jgi:hypothetical protein
VPDLADLTPAGVTIPDAELHEAVVAEDAASLGQEVRCILATFDDRYAEDPMPWTPVTVAKVGTWFPKRDDRAIVAFPEGGTPVISQWWPSADTPDVSF